MKKSVYRWLSLLLVMMVVTGMSACSNKSKSGKNTKNPLSTQNPVKTGPKSTGKQQVDANAPGATGNAPVSFGNTGLKDALVIAERYYHLSVDGLSPQEKSYLPTIINWKPDFSGKAKDSDKAAQYSNLSAYLTTYTDLKGIYLSLACAAFALDTTNVTAAGNLATAIATFLEDHEGKPLASCWMDSGNVLPYADDAAKIYEYALSLQPEKDYSMIPIYLNYGYLCIDCNRLDRAEQMFAAALAVAPGYFPATEGMAAYWLAKGDRNKAEQLLKNSDLPMVYRQLKKNIEQTSEEKLPAVMPGESTEVMESKLKSMAAVEPILATDFYAHIDPEGASKAKQFVIELQKSIRYTAPDFNYLSQYSTLKSFYDQGGQAAYEAFCDALMKLEDRMVSTQESRNLSVDMLMPETAIFSLKPSSYANPTDITAQMYNVAMLIKKRNGYQTYLAKQQEELMKVVAPANQNLTEKLERLEQALYQELDELQEKHEASCKASSQDCSSCVLIRHQIHQKYNLQLNNAAETAFMDVTNFVSTRYIQHIKPNIEAMYMECMEHILLISDPEIRSKAEKNLKKTIERSILTVFSIVREAYSIEVLGYPYSCDCTDAELEAAAERERKAWEAYDAQLTAMHNKARKAFESGEIPENSQLYQRLDRYSSSYQLMFMKARWHPLKTEVNFDIKGLGPEIALKMIQDHARNTTTYGGGLTFGVGEVSAAGGMFGANASVGISGQMTVDGGGNIISAEVAGSLQGKVSAGTGEAGATFEVSSRRGCKVSAEVTKVLDEIIRKPEELEIFLPEKPKKVLWQGEYK